MQTLPLYLALSILSSSFASAASCFDMMKIWSRTSPTVISLCGPGGGSLGGRLPLPLSSAMIHYQLKVDTPLCDGLQAAVKRREALAYKDTAHADTILTMIVQSNATITRTCTPASQRWFEQVRVGALLTLDRYAEALTALPDADLDSRQAEMRAFALMRLGRHEDAEALYLLADSLYSRRADARDAVLAIIQVNHAWNLYFMSRHHEARALLDSAYPVLRAACCAPWVVASLKEADHLTGRMAGKGYSKPGSKRSGLPLMAAALVVALVAGWLAGRFRRRRRPPPPHSDLWLHATQT